MSQNQDNQVQPQEVNKIDQSQLQSKDIFQISQQNNVQGLQDNLVISQVQMNDSNHHSDSIAVNNLKRP